MARILRAMCAVGCCALIALWLGTRATAQPADAAMAAIDAIFTRPHVDAGLFSPAFLTHIPTDRIEAIRDNLIATLGAYKNTAKNETGYLATFERGTDSITIHLDAAGKIDGVFFRAPQAASLDDALAQLRAFAGKLSYVVIENGHDRAALEADTPFSVGSAFKLAVLNALTDEIAAGRRAWNQIVPLRPEWKSLPSGLLQTWPDGSAITLQTYAALMISQSDNTAADALARIVGTSAIKPYADGNDPFLTTLEMFKLKSKPGTALRERYRKAAAPAERAAILVQADTMPAPQIGEIDVAPSLLDIEWHYSVRRLCALAQRVADLPLMSITPGGATPADWAHVAYKGGSDFGVINMTTVLTAKDGRKLCVSATLNNPAKPIDETAFISAYTFVLRALR